MKKKRKSLLSRIFTAALAFVVSITTFAGFGAGITAKAVTLQLEYIHGDFWYFWGVSNNGSAFCIQKGVSANSWDEYTAMYKDEYYYAQDHVTLTKAQKLALGRAQYYGYPYEYKSRQAFCATQAIIWEIMDGSRNATTMKLTGTGHKWELWSDEYALYDEISYNMIHHKDVPSFDGATAHLKWKASEHAYYKAFYDYNDILADKATREAFVNKLKAVNGVTNATCTYDSTKKHYITKIWASKPVNLTVTADKVFDFDSSKFTDVVVYSNEWRSQALTSGVKIDPASFTIKLQTEPVGSATITKEYVDETGTTVTGSAKTTLIGQTKFRIKDSTGAYLKLTGSAGSYAYSSTVANATDATSIALNASGKFSISGMPKGTYTLIESQAPTKYAKIANKQFTITSGKTTSKTYTNTENPTPESVTLEKEWVDSDGNSMTHSEFVAKYGADYVANCEDNVYFLAYIVVNGTRYYFTVDYTAMNNTVGGSQTAIRSSYMNMPLFYKGDSTSITHRYYNLNGNQFDSNMTDIVENAFHFSISNGKKIKIGYLFDTFETPSFFGLTTSNNKWTDKTVYFEEIIEPEGGSGQTLHPISFWSYNDTDATTGSTTLKTTDITIGDEGTAYNYKRSFTLKLSKKDTLTLSSVAGAEYTLYDSNGVELETVTTDENGKATFETRTDSSNVYTVKETKAPKNYLIDTTVYTVTAAITGSNIIAMSAGALANSPAGFNGMTASGNVSETEKYGTINIIKKDNFGSPVANIQFAVTADTDLKLKDGYYTTDTSVEGTLYAAGSTLATLTTNAEGKASITNLALDVTYTVKETSKSAPYVVVNNTQSVKIVDTDDTGTVQYMVENLDFTNTVQEVKLNVIKKDSKDGGNLAGAEFSVKAAEDVVINGKKLQSKGEEIGTLTTGADGTATNRPETVGDDDKFPVYVGYSYTITETKAPEGYILPTNVADRTKTVKVTYSNTANQFYVESSTTFENTPQTGSVYVYKLDNESKAIPLSGATFKLTAAENVTNSLGDVVYAKGATISTVTTGADGKGKFPVDVPVGFQYTITETNPPKNFKAAAPQTFALAYDVNVEHVNVTKTFYDDEIQGGVEIIKRDGATKVGLAGAKFNVVVAEDILKADGSVRYAKGTVVVKDLTTDANGKATYSGLYMGEYKLVETKAPEYFNIYKGDLPFELTENRTLVSVPVDETRQTGEITVFKYDNEVGTVGLAGAKFKVYPAEDVINTDGKIFTVQNSKGETVSLTKGTTIDTVTTGADGKATFPTKLPVGYSYTVEEVEAPKNYTNPHEKQTFDLMYNAEVEFVAIDKKYYNDYQTGEITVKKKDAKTGDAVPEAEFTLYTVDDVKRADGSIKTVINMKGEKITLKAGTAIDVLSTDADGIAKFTTRVPVGYSYKLKETKTPDGYIKSNAEYEFDLTYNAAVEYVPVEQLVNNTPIEVEISKKDAKTGDELKDAQMQLLDEEENLIEEWTSDGTFHKVSKLKVGNYILREKAAPKGYTLATDIKFSVDETNTVTVNGTEVTAKSDDDIPLITMYDGATKVAVSKQDANGKELKGATLQIIDSENNIVKEWVSDGTNKVITNLPVGDYTLHEKAAPKGYLISTDIKFNIDEHNKVTIGKTVVTAKTTDGTPIIKMVDKAKTVKFHKIDDEGNSVAGAKLRIVDSEGKVVKEWTSSAEPMVLTAQLGVGLTYEVEELEARKGYCLIGKFSFTVSSSADADIVKIVNKPTIVEVSKVSLTGQQEIAGAKMQILDEENNVIDEWISTTAPHILRAKLEAGKKYYVHEVTPPKGYVYSEDVAFTVSTDGSTDTVKMDDDDTKVAISKRDAYGKELKGATLQIIDSENNIVKEWVSDGTSKVVRNLPAGTYILRETAAPDGYCIATEIKFTIDSYNMVTVDGVKVKAVSDDEIPLIVMVDEATKVQFHKLDDEGNNLAGATLRIVDSEGKVVKEWISEEEPYELTAALTAGLEYTLEEVKQPHGYCLIGAFAFSVSTNGEVDIVNIVNKPTIVEVSKKFLTGEDEVEGALMQILDEEGNVIDEWTSTNVPHVLRAQLEANKKYYVHEVTPPKFYTLTDDVEFTVSGDGSVDEVVMYDDVQRGTIEVQKRTEGDLNIEGIEFILEGTSDTGLEVKLTAKTDENGLAVFEGVPTGTYTITENGDTVPYAYLAADEQEVTVEYAQTSNITFFNDEKTGSIEVHKRTEGDLNLEGIEFILSGTSDSGKEISVTATTDKNGVAVFENIPVGTYVITENGETVPSAYLAAEPTEVTVEYATTTTQEIYNEEKSGTIKINKRTADMTNIEGIEFILTGTSDSGRDIRLTATTDENGIATFENVPIGTYVITENGETVPTGYLVADKQSVTVYESKESSVTFENKKKETPKLVTPNRPNAVTKDSGIDQTATVAFMSLIIPVIAVALLSKRRKEEE